MEVSAAPAAVRHAVVRARWALVQTGLITSGLALFGVYVLSRRTNGIELMQWRLRSGFPAGPALVGAACAIGYLLGSWWTGVRVRGWLLAGIFALQLLAYAGAHYAEFTTHPLFWSDTEQPVSFPSYFHFFTIDNAATGTTRSAVSYAYLLRAGEFLAFSALVMLCPFVLIWRRRCAICGQSTFLTPIGSIASPDDLRSIQHALMSQQPLAILRKYIVPAPGPIGLTLQRCPVCATSQLVPSNGATPLTIPAALGDELTSQN